MSKINKQAQSGFTLIELAIVLVIIGLIIGGILKGQELIENARVKNVMAQVNSYQAATVAFEDKYGALPGDLGTAEDYIPNCVAGNSCLIAETQNGQIGGDAGDNYVAAVNTALSENIAYWVQLALSRFIGGIEVSATGGSDIYGSRFPSAATGGGFQVIYQPDTGRHLVRLASVTGAVTNAAGALRPDQALQLDTRMDDGQPLTGTVFSNATLSATTCHATTAGSPYLAKNIDQTCNLVFEIK